MSQLAFGSEPGLGPGDACGRCFKVTATADPYSAGFTGPFKTIVLKVNNLCPAGNNSQWCGQTTSKPTNSFGQSVQCVIISSSTHPLLSIVTAGALNEIMS